MSPATSLDFVRGDADQNGSLSLADPITILFFMFAGGTVTCLDAADYDDGGTVNLADPIGLLFFLFAGGAPPAPPFPLPGSDPNPDALDCN